MVRNSADDIGDEILLFLAQFSLTSAPWAGMVNHTPPPGSAWRVPLRRNGAPPFRKVGEDPKKSNGYVVDGCNPAKTS